MNHPSSVLRVLFGFVVAVAAEAFAAQGENPSMSASPLDRPCAALAQPTPNPTLRAYVLGYWQALAAPRQTSDGAGTILDRVKYACTIDSELSLSKAIERAFAMRYGPTR